MYSQALKQLVTSALDDLYTNDLYLIDHRQPGLCTGDLVHLGEASIAFRLGHYLARHICEDDIGVCVRSYQLDSEYNRNIYGYKCDSSGEVYRPDLILHK
jgi:hypothetical protein